MSPITAAFLAFAALVLAATLLVTGHEKAGLDEPDHFYAARCCPAQNGETLLCSDGTKAEEYRILK